MGNCFLGGRKLYDVIFMRSDNTRLRKLLRHRDLLSKTRSRQINTFVTACSLLIDIHKNKIFVSIINQENRD